jgi:hypothetical protein
MAFLCTVCTTGTNLLVTLLSSKLISLSLSLPLPLGPRLLGLACNHTWWFRQDPQPTAYGISSVETFCNRDWAVLVGLPSDLYTGRRNGYLLRTREM